MIVMLDLKCQSIFEDQSKGMEQGIIPFKEFKYQSSMAHPGCTANPGWYIFALLLQIWREKKKTSWSKGIISYPLLAMTCNVFFYN